LELNAISYPSEGNEACFQIEEQSFWFQHRNVLIQSLVQHFCARSVFFDVGGGNGFVTKGLQDAGTTAVLVEPGSQGVLNARKRGVEHVVQSMWSPDIVRPKCAEAIGLFDVVEHIQDDIGFLKGVHQTLAPDGLVFITVPALHSLWSYEDIYAGHFRRYRLGELQRLLINTGFKVEYNSYFFSMLPLPIFALRSVPSFLGLRKSPDTASIRKEHSNAKGMAGRLMDRWLQWEQSRKINSLRSIHNG
jgi:SAM-dependent methyltransferase